MRTIKDFCYIYKLLEDLKKTIVQYEGDGGRQISQDKIGISYDELYSVEKRIREIRDEFLNLEI